MRPRLAEDGLSAFFERAFRDDVNTCVDNVEEMLRQWRRILIGREVWILATMSFPAAVCAGTTNTGYLAFVNQTIVSPGRGSPLVVFADPLDQVVASAGYRIDFRDLSLHRILWVP